MEAVPVSTRAKPSQLVNYTLPAEYEYLYPKGETTIKVLFRKHCVNAPAAYASSSDPYLPTQTDVISQAHELRGTKPEPPVIIDAGGAPLSYCIHSTCFLITIRTVRIVSSVAVAHALPLPLPVIVPAVGSGEVGANSATHFPSILSVCSS